MTAKLILASASPRRKELLDQIGVSYAVHAVDIDETPRAGENPEDYVCRVAAEKSAECLQEVNLSLPVLSADTSVVIGDTILGKPNDLQHAECMLQQLSGNIHYVFSAVSLRCRQKGDLWQHFQTMSKTAVKFKTLSRSEIEQYCLTGESMGKAGAYAIQGLASVFVESIQGSFSGVVGLPLFETAELLTKQGIFILHE